MPEAPPYFLFMAFAGGVGAVLVLTKKKNLALAWAFLMFSLLSIGIYLDWPSGIRIAIGALLGFFLAMDLVVRAAKRKI